MLAMDKVVRLPIKQEPHTSICVGVSTLKDGTSRCPIVFLPPLKQVGFQTSQKFL